MARATSTAAPTPNPDETRRPVKIKVKLVRSTSGQYEIKSSHPIPNAEIVRAYMSKRSLPTLNNVYYRGTAVQTLINSTLGLIKPKEWADAIAKASAQILNQQSRVETELLAVEGGGYMAIGNALFELKVVDYIESGPKALRVLRQQVIADAKAEGDAFILAAQQKADGIRAQGDTYYSEQVVKGKQIMLQHEAIRQQGLTLPPEWCRVYGVPVIVRNTATYIGFFAKIKIKQFEFNYEGHMGNIAAKDAPPFSVLIWAPTERFSTSSMFCDQEFGYLPHMSSTACVTIGDAPKELNSLAALTQLRTSVERAFSVVNMSSLLSTPNHWKDEIKAFIPSKLDKVFKDTYDRTDIPTLLAKHKIKPDSIDANEEIAHVFTVKDSAND